MSVDQHIERLKTAATKITPTSFNWLQGLEYAASFVVCVGAGPWKEGRRRTVQHRALELLDFRDISEIHGCDWYPFDWQNDMVQHMGWAMRELGIDFATFCAHMDDADDRFMLYEAAGRPKGTKVLSLFCRDALHLPTFPIDRWVRRWLQAYDLPVDEAKIIDLCNRAGIDPSSLNRGIVTEGFSGNPDWSNHDKRNHGGIHSEP